MWQTMLELKQKNELDISLSQMLGQKARGPNGAHRPARFTFTGISLPGDPGDDSVIDEINWSVFRSLSDPRSLNRWI